MIYTTCNYLNIMNSNNSWFQARSVLYQYALRMTG
nr:MAG TPA: hypothetical protein [Caudoviricetes sp.]DAV93745.1 MAG TPA: hypothetical protein [Caudoviricetes sp.]